MSSSTLVSLLRSPYMRRREELRLFTTLVLKPISDLNVYLILTLTCRLESHDDTTFEYSIQRRDHIIKSLFNVYTNLPYT